MKVTHSHSGLEVSREITEDVGFMLNNNLGDYLYLSDYCNSKYKGFFVFVGDSMYRILANITTRHLTEELVNRFHVVDRNKGTIGEHYFVPDDHHALVYELDRTSDICLELDVKESYDNTEWGRHYEAVKHKNAIIIRFTHDNGYEFYIAIVADNHKPHMKDSWIKHDYTLDRERGSAPFERYVYNMFDLHAKKVVLAASPDKKTALKTAQYVYKNTAKLKKKKKRKLHVKELGKEHAMAYLCAQNALKNLVIDFNKKKRMFAGLPWFFHFWARDEAISVKTLDNETRKKILFESLKYIGYDGRIINRIPRTALGSADATGWVFKRLGDCTLNAREKKHVREQLLHSLYLLDKFKTHNHLEYNSDQETWMDTVYANDTRSGYRIEIQALRLFMYNFMYTLSGDRQYHKAEHDMQREVRTHFFKDDLLHDGLGDATIRPNVFLAAYIYPDILKKREWQACFDKVMPRLWLSWGGITTIDTSHPLFTDTYSGETPRSYHRGDSWFWVNNLAAIVLHHTNDPRYHVYIHQILDASTEDILWKGIIGCGSELSSAKEQKPEGCLNQAWTSALYIELIESLAKD